MPQEPTNTANKSQTNSSAQTTSISAPIPVVLNADARNAGQGNRRSRNRRNRNNRRREQQLSVSPSGSDISSSSPIELTIGKTINLKPVEYIDHPSLTVEHPISKKRIPVKVAVVADVAVVGAGIAGLTAADKQAEAGRTSIVFEKRKKNMSGASGINPGRAGLGFHYADEPTAFLYLRATVAFIRKYQKAGQDFRLGFDKLPENHPLRQGRYFIPKRSLVPAETLMEIYRSIREEYRKLCKEDPQNQVFGDPDTFYKVLSYKDYKNDINLDQDIALAIETREQLLDVERFRTYLIEQVEKNEKIQSLTNAEVVKIERSLDLKHFVITVNHDGRTEHYATTRLINASWESTDKLNETLGIPMEPPGFDLVLVTDVTDDEAIKLSEVKKEGSDKKDKRPVLVKNAAGDIRVYGNTTGSKWTFTQLNKETKNKETSLDEQERFRHVKFPKKGDVTVYKKGSVPVYIRDEIARKKAHTPSAFRTNRIKILAEVELPEELHNKPCMFFAIGQFCMFSNMQNGRALMTYAPETNYIQSKAVSLTPEEEKRLYEGFNEQETIEIGNKILKGVSEFIPEMAKAKLIGIRGGVVKTYGDVDLCDPASDVHKRYQLGIQELAIGALEISSMKLLYGPENAERANDLLNLFDEVEKQIDLMSASLAADYTKVAMQLAIHRHVLEMLMRERLLKGLKFTSSFTDSLATLVQSNMVANLLELMHTPTDSLSIQTSPITPLSPATQPRQLAADLETSQVYTTPNKTLTHFFSLYLKQNSTVRDIDDPEQKKKGMEVMKNTAEQKANLNASINPELIHNLKKTIKA